jgi:ABC-2 type transport system ATP-binding protein
MTDVISSSALNIKGLFKHFEGKYAVDNLDLDISVGEFHALLGPNGAGKTTTLRIVAGLLKADAGQVTVLGHNVLRDPQVAKREMAFLPDDPLLYGKLSALEYLEFVAGLWEIDANTAANRATDLLKWLELWDKADQQTEGYSRGMRQKLALAGALIHQIAAARASARAVGDADSPTGGPFSVMDVCREIPAVIGDAITSWA